MAYSQYDLTNTSLVKTGNLTEMYIPLWWYSSSYAQGKGSTSASGASGGSCIYKGAASFGQPYTYVGSNLHTLNPNWSNKQSFAFEASIASQTSGTTHYFSLWDITSNSQVSASQISTSSTTFIVIRSGSFTLIPGHSYAILTWCSSTTDYSYMSKASLIAFLQ